MFWILRARLACPAGIAFETKRVGVFGRLKWPAPGGDRQGSEARFSFLIGGHAVRIASKAT